MNKETSCYQILSMQLYVIVCYSFYISAIFNSYDDHIGKLLWVVGGGVTWNSCFHGDGTEHLSFQTGADLLTVHISPPTDQGPGPVPVSRCNMRQAPIPVQA